MRIKLSQIGFLFLLISTIAITSCTLANNGDSSYRRFRRDVIGHHEIATNDNFTENTDVLFMMYLDGDNNLNNVSWQNLMDAQTGLMNLEENTKVTVIALIDGNKEKVEEKGNTPVASEQTFLFKLGAYTATEYNKKYITAASSIDYSGCVEWISGTYYEVDMSSGDTLYNFLNWSKKHYNANKTILTVQNHGGGPYNELTSSISSRSICWDDTTDNNKYLSTTDVATAINKTFGKIDMLIEDVCLQCSIEEIYGLQDAVHYLVASPNTTYGNTYNYDKIIPYASKGASIEEIGKKFIDYNYEFCKNQSLRKENTPDSDSTCMELSLTLVDCSKTDVLENIKTHTSELADAIMNTADNAQKQLCINSIGQLEKNAGTNFYGFCFEATYAYTNDLGAMAYLLSEYIEDDAINTAANKLFSDLNDNNLIISAWAGGKYNDEYTNWYYTEDSNYGYGFLKGKKAWGISITGGRISMQDTSGKLFVSPNLINYRNWSNFAKDNKWAELLVTYKNGD